MRQPRAQARPCGFISPAAEPRFSAIVRRARWCVPAGDRAETILIVDDEPGVRELLAEMVRDLGYRVFAASDGPSALALIDAGTSVDLLLTDYAMPHGMTGDMLVRAARERRGMKALLISGFAIGARDNHIGGIAILDKPCRQAELARAIREVLLTEQSA